VAGTHGSYRRWGDWGDLLSCAAAHRGAV